MIKARPELELSNIQKLFLELDNRDLITPSDARKQKLDDQFALRAVGSILHDFYFLERLLDIFPSTIDKSNAETTCFISEMEEILS